MAARNSLLGKAEPPLEPPEPQFCEGGICVLGYLFARRTILTGSTNSFLTSNTEMEQGVPRKHNPKNIYTQAFVEVLAVFTLCQDCVRVVVGFFEGFFLAIIDYFLAWGLEGAPMQPSQSLPGKSLLPGLVHGAAEDRREEASSMYFCTL